MVGLSLNSMYSFQSATILKLSDLMYWMHVTDWEASILSRLFTTPLAFSEISGFSDFESMKRFFHLLVKLSQIFFSLHFELKKHPFISSIGNIITAIMLYYANTSRFHCGVEQITIFVLPRQGWVTFLISSGNHDGTNKRTLQMQRMHIGDLGGSTCTATVWFGCAGYSQWPLLSRLNHFQFNHYIIVMI